MLKSKNKKLLSQIAKGNAEKVSKLLKKGASVNKKDERGWTTLHVASEKGNAEVIDAILSGISTIDCMDDMTADSFPKTALNIACENGHTDIVRLLLEKGSHPDKKNHAQDTPLHIAARSDTSRLDIMKQLVAKGANVDSRNETDDTPLHIAALRERIDDIQLLLSAGADVSTQNSKGKTALDYAKNTTIRNILLSQSRALIQEEKINNFYFKPGYSPLHMSSDQGCITKVQNILKSGVDVNKKTDPFCFTALHLASAKGHKDIVEILLENGADINAENKGGNTPIHIAARSTHCHEHVVQLLIETGANINAKTKRQNTPLHYAAQNGHTAIVKLLVDAGALLDEKNNKGRMAFHYAKNQDIRNFLRSEHSKVDYHSINSISDISDTTSILNTSSACLSDGTSNIFCTEESKEDCGNKVEEKHRLRSAMGNSKSDRSASSLLKAAEQGCINEVRNILTRGADVNQKTPSGFTALHLACSCGHKDIAELLVENGADIEVENLTGNTALHIVTRSIKPREDIIQLLIDKGANVNSKTKRGYTPLHYANENGYEGVVKLLLDNDAILCSKQ